VELDNTIGAVLHVYGLDSSEFFIQRIDSGHINYTYKLAPGYILQRINKHVFRNPQALSNNLQVASDFLKLNAPD